MAKKYIQKIHTKPLKYKKLKKKKKKNLKTFEITHKKKSKHFQNNQN